MNTWRVLHGDVRERLADLADGSAQCVVTSPPYWGLRDYGTARWDGGDPVCDHLPARDIYAAAVAASGLGGGKANQANAESSRSAYRNVCGKCGACRIDSQIGLEPTPDAYVQSMVQVFREVRRVLKDDGTCWLNLGDSYAHSLRQSSNHAGDKQNTNRGSIRRGFAPIVQGFKEKDLVGIPWRVAFALQADGWYLRSDIIWAKPNPMPESVTDRPTKAHEYIFLLTKRASYYYDADAIREEFAPETLSSNGIDVKSGRGYVSNQRITPKDRNAGGDVGWGNQAPGATRSLNIAGRNKRSVWTVPTAPYPDAHFATFPPALVEPCILAGSRMGDTVLDPFCGSGTTGAVAIGLGRNFIGVELNAAYIELARKRIGAVAPMFAQELSA